MRDLDSRDPPRFNLSLPGLTRQSRTAAMFERTYWVYILASGRNGTLYVGVTNNLSRRVWEHREGRGGEFTSRYGVKLLVYYETFPDVRNAIQREKNIKKWPRRWKLDLIETLNREWRDLYEELA
jgi:putative endonuclease